MAKAIRMKDESGQLLPVTNGVLVQYNSSYSVSSYISNLVEEIANTEEATAAALTTLNHKDNIIMAYIDNIWSTYVTYSYLNSFLDTEILPAIPTVDNRILSSSENPVQNKVIYEALEDVRVTVDTALDASSYNPVRNSVITQTIINNENTTSQALHGLDTRITDLEGKNTLTYYDASWLCGYTDNSELSDTLTSELISSYNDKTPILINGKTCDIVYSVTQPQASNGATLNANMYRVWISYTRTLGYTLTDDYHNYGVGDGSLALNTTYLYKLTSPIGPTHYKKISSYDTEINPLSILQEMYREFGGTDAVLYSYNTRITDLETAYTYFSDIDDELSETSYKALTNARITQEFDTLSDVTATALTDHENRLGVIERRYNVVDNSFTQLNNRVTALENYKNGQLAEALSNFRNADTEFAARISALEQSLELVNTLLNTIVYGAQEV